VFIDALPKNNYGKVLKTELRAQDAGASDARVSGEHRGAPDPDPYR
jgi:long-chain acyl-CoA synthetase